MEIWNRLVVATLSLGMLSACGSTATHAAPVDEDRVARRVADILLERQEEDALGAHSGAVGDTAGVAGPPSDVERLQIPVDGAPSQGAAEPLVTIVAISDFECPFCSRVLPTLARLLETYPNELRLAFRHNPLPFHQNAPLAHQAAIEAFEQGGDDAFWRMHDVLFQNQRSLARADLERYAQAQGLAMDRFRDALDDGRHLRTIGADQTIARRLEARGTPTFFINGRKIAGAQPFEEFDRLVREELILARRALQRGVARAALYGWFMTDALHEAPGPVRPIGPAPTRPQPDPNAVYAVPVRESPVRGRATALITLIVFSDFECPFCQRVLPTLEQIREEYGDEVRIAFRNNPLPFHSNAMPAAEAAREAFAQAGNRGFWRMHDLLFSHQRELDRASLESYARQSGLNVRRFRRALDQHTHQAVIEADQALARQIGATGTPSFFINGRNLRGAQPFGAFRTLIEEELEKARALVGEGVPRRRLYERIIEDGATEPQMVDGERPALEAAAAPEAPSYELDVPRDAPTRGPRRAPVVVQVFTDFQCPFCSRALPTVERLLEEHPRHLRLVFRNYPLPFHTDAPLAHEAALEVHRQGGNTKFWTYHDLLFANQRALSRADLETYAQQVGVNMTQFRRALDRRGHRARVQQDIDAIGAAGAQIGTPSFFFNGRLLQGAQPYEAFEAAFQSALEGNR